MFAALCLIFFIAAVLSIQLWWPLSLALGALCFYFGNKSSITGDDAIAIVGVLGLIGMVVAGLFGVAAQVWNY